MKPNSQSPDADAPLQNSEDEVTGLPLLPTWRRVYWFVLVVFVVYVGLLIALQKVFI